MSREVELPSVRQFSVKRLRDGVGERTIDTVAVEEPLHISVSYKFKEVRLTQTFAVTMRTPGNDPELTAGLLLSEGVIRERADLVQLRSLGTQPSNEMLAELADSVDYEGWKDTRHVVMNSSCGVCGRRSTELFAEEVPKPESHAAQFSSSLIQTLPALIEAHQKGFAQTGGLHAAARVAKDGAIHSAFEDIGRHNALDKLIGSSFLNNELPLQDSILFLSSRSSFELVQKTIAAGAPMLATVGSPSSLAVETARHFGLTLVGFVRERRFNVYSGDWRINLK